MQSYIYSCHRPWKKWTRFLLAKYNIGFFCEPQKTQGYYNIVSILLSHAHFLPGLPEGFQLNNCISGEDFAYIFPKWKGAR